MLHTQSTQSILHFPLYRKIVQYLLNRIVFAIGFCFVYVFAIVHASNINTKTTIAFQHCENGVCRAIDNAVFTKKFTEGEVIPMRLVIKNPEHAPIFSVQSWVKYNPSVFSITNLSDSESAFDLAAPGEFKAINSKGEMRIGRAVIGSPVTDSEIVIADFSVTVKKNPNLSTFSFLDFKNSEIGKTAIVVIHNNIPANILEEKPKNLLFKNLKGTASQLQVISSSSQSTPSVSQGNYENTVNMLESEGNINTSVSAVSVEGNDATVTELQRPTGFRTRTFSDGAIEMVWELDPSSAVKGYYLYYSTTSGTYMHRRDMGKTNTYRFNKNFFKKGRKIFFAVQAYAANGIVSDFSDETFVIVGEEGSESHPFFEQIFPTAQKVGEDINQNKAYYLKEGEVQNTITGQRFQNADISEQHNTVITGTRNIQSGLNWNIMILLLGGIMMMLSAMYLILGRKEV